MRRIPNLVRYFPLLLGWPTIIPTSAVAQAPPRITTAVLQSATLSFSGHATVGSFVGSTTTASGEVTGDLSTARGWVASPVATLVTHNDRRDRDLRASMEVNQYPTMRFDLERTTVVASLGAHGDSVTVILHGRLSIHGVSRATELPATVVRAGGAIHVTSAFPLDLEDYHIGGLTKAFGLLRMDHMIEVHLDLSFVVPVAEPSMSES